MSIEPIKAPQEKDRMSGSGLLSLAKFKIVYGLAPLGWLWSGRNEFFLLQLTACFYRVIPVLLARYCRVFLRISVG